LYSSPFEVVDSFDLAVAQAGRVEGGQVLQAGAERLWLRHPFAQRLRAVKAEHFARARPRVARVSEAGEDAGRLVDEGERLGRLDPFELRGRVVRRLFLDGSDLGAL
jgi:hypothetical protein